MLGQIEGHESEEGRLVIGERLHLSQRTLWRVCVCVFGYFLVCDRCHDVNYDKGTEGGQSLCCIKI